MARLTQKRILLGVTGGIAAYKSADLVRRLREDGADVRVVMTRGACEFVTPLTFQALSGKPVHTDLLDHNAEAAMGHIELARWCDCILVAPASANFMARLAHGLADDLLTTVCLAADTPVVLAPAMNQQMWQNPATEANTHTLQERRITLLGPDTGSQACGETGPGRMLEPPALLQAVGKLFENDQLTAKRLVITAGPTREAIDPVRYLSNRSSGKMGYAIARAAAEAGAAVTLVSGPTAIDKPDRVERLPVTTAQEMHDAVMSVVTNADIFIAAAAVADYRSRDITAAKIKKTAAYLQLNLEKTPDILAAVAGLGDKRPFTVGFAAETDALIDNAREKLVAKKLDMIAANLVSDSQGFDQDDNALQVLWPDGEVALDLASKDKLARRLIALVAERFHAGRPDQAAG